MTDPEHPVGNVRFSPDQMMNRMEEVPPWLDLFQLSQLLIWMLQEKPVKNWNRPLDWRWVNYPATLSNHFVVKVKAVTAVCSSPHTSPKDASELLVLWKTLFPAGKTLAENQEPMGQKTAELQEIVTQGKAMDIIRKTDTANTILFSKWFSGFYRHTEPAFLK